LHACRWGRRSNLWCWDIPFAEGIADVVAYFATRKVVTRPGCWMESSPGPGFRLESLAVEFALGHRNFVGISMVMTGTTRSDGIGNA
jgi:hypothetical protein